MIVLLAVAAVHHPAARGQDRPGKAEAPAPVFVPSFWDPAAVLEKPNTSALGPIRFATEGDDPPFGFTLPDGTLAGFDIDLARAICEELQASCTIQARRFDTIIPALKAGAADAALASIAITPGALTQVDFTSPYYKTPARFVARAGATTGEVTPATLRGKRVGVVGGTAHEAYLEAFFPDLEIERFATAEDARAKLKSGALDLVFGDAIALAQWLGSPEAAGCCAFTGGPYIESSFFGLGAGIAVAKGHTALRKALDYGLARVAASGRYGDLYLKYFPIGIY